MNSVKYLVSVSRVRHTAAAQLPVATAGWRPCRSGKSLVRAFWLNLLSLSVSDRGGVFGKALRAGDRLGGS